MTKTHKRRIGTAPTGATAATAPAARTGAVPAWLGGGGLALALVGLAASAYLTYEHFTQSTTLACPEGQVVNCAKVTASPWSSFLGIPVAVLGLLYFVAVVALCLPQAWRAPRLLWPRIAVLGVGTVMVLYLVWAELFGVGAICLWCTVVHVVTVLLLALALVAWALLPRR